MSKTIKAVAIVGGTHGNEFTGPHLLRRWQQNPEEIARPSFTTKTFLANPKAFGENRRFVDEDLNRCFRVATLQTPDSRSYEVGRAKELNDEIGPKGRPKHDFIIDLHTSTSNCGPMLILLSDDAFSLRLAAYVSSQVPESRICYFPPSDGDQHFLGSIAARSLGVEIGPVPQGLLRYDIFELARKVVVSALDFVHHNNTGIPMALPAEVEVFKSVGQIEFPSDGPYAEGVVHESLQDRDYQPLNPGDPLFRNLDGSVVRYEGAETVYPIFINEAAYYYKHVAMVLTTKQTQRVPHSE